MRSVLASVAVLVTAAAMGQPIFVERMIFQRPAPEVRRPMGPLAELIGELSAESSEERRHAADALLRMGPAIEPELRWARQQGESGGRPLSWPSHHVRESNKWVQDARHLQPWHAENELDVLISHLDERRRSGTSMITLQYTNAPLTNVLRDFGRQADADVAVGGWYSWPEIDAARATISVDRVNFWAALEAIQRSTGLTPIHANAENRLVLTVANSPTNMGGAVVSGVLKIVPVAADVVTVTLGGFVEPKLSQTGPHAMVTISECVDDQGGSLLASGKRKFMSVENHNSYAWHVPLELRPPELGRRIKMLRGAFSVGIGPTDRYVTITNVLRSEGKSRELDGVRVTVKRVKASGSQIDVELSAPKESPATWSASSGLDVWLWDEWRATIISEQVFNGIRREGDQEIATWTLTTPPNSPPPATLVWKTRAETRWHTVPFELHDIAVP